ncbi:MAG: TolC family protein [Deltaproteobacteria bacterium]|nr:TolC family protein [Deltaproteobacteria bacterium]
MVRLILIGSAVLAALVFGEADRTEVRAPSLKTNPNSIHLNELIEEALNNNAELAALKHEVTVRDSQIGPKGSYEDPMVAVEAMNFPVNNLRRDQFGMTGVQLSLTQKIPFPGKLSKLSRVASYSKDSQSSLFDKKRLELVRDIKKAYYGLFVLTKRREILTEQKDLVRQILASARNQYALGKMAQAEVLSFQVEETNYLDQLLSVEREMRDMQGEINHLIGRADHQHYMALSPDEPVKSHIDFSKVTQESIVKTALDKNPSIRAAHAETEAAEASLSYAQWNYLPDFEFKLGYTFRQPSPGDAGTDFVSGMVGISVPIWALSKQSEERRGAEALKMKSEAMLSETRNELSHRVHLAFASLEEASERLKLYDSGVLPLVRQAVVAGKAAYLTRKIEYSTLLNLLNRRFQAENSYYEALTTYQIKVAELEALAGAPLEEL